MLIAMPVLSMKLQKSKKSRALETEENLIPLDFFKVVSNVLSDGSTLLPQTSSWEDPNVFLKETQDMDKVSEKKKFSNKNEE